MDPCQDSGGHIWEHLQFQRKNTKGGMSRSMLIRTGAQLPTKAEDVLRVDEHKLQPKGTKAGGGEGSRGGFSLIGLFIDSRDIFVEHL